MENQGSEKETNIAVLTAILNTMISIEKKLDAIIAEEKRKSYSSNQINL